MLGKNTTTHFWCTCTWAKSTLSYHPVMHREVPQTPIRLDGIGVPPIAVEHAITEPQKLFYDRFRSISIRGSRQRGRETDKQTIREVTKLRNPHTFGSGVFIIGADRSNVQKKPTCQTGRHFCRFFVFFHLCEKVEGDVEEGVKSQ